MGLIFLRDLQFFVIIESVPVVLWEKGGVSLVDSLLEVNHLGGVVSDHLDLHGQLVGIGLVSPKAIVLFFYLLMQQSAPIQTVK